MSILRPLTSTGIPPQQSLNDISTLIMQNFTNSLFASNQDIREFPPKFSHYSEYIVYVDESGTSNFADTDPHYPVFVLAFCIFQKRYYVSQFVPSVQTLKFNYFGHDMVILHEKEIRKKEPPFTFETKAKEIQFISDLDDTLHASRFVLIASVIDKLKIPHQSTSTSAYNIALNFCLEKLYQFLLEKNSHHQKTFIIFESRGKKEDNELELEFRRICDANNRYKAILPFDIIISSKKVNSIGLQIADLVARPIGRHIIDGDKHKNRAFEVLKQKFYCENPKESGKNFEGFGLNIYPR